MAVKKTDSEYTDAKGNVHKVLVDGRAEIYYGGFDKSAQYAEITDGADEAVNRKRFIKMIPQAVEETLQVRNDSEIATTDLDTENAAKDNDDNPDTEVEDDASDD